MAAILADQLLLCLACKHEWTEKIIYNVGVAVWVAHVRSLACPVCGANSERLAFKTPEPPGDGPEGDH